MNMNKIINSNSSHGPPFPLSLFSSTLTLALKGYLSDEPSRNQLEVPSLLVFLFPSRIFLISSFLSEESETGRQIFRNYLFIGVLSMPT